MIRNRLRTGIPHDWVVIGLCVSAITPLAMITLGVGALYPFIQEDLGTSRAELGALHIGQAYRWDHHLGLCGVAG